MLSPRKILLIAALSAAEPVLAQTIVLDQAGGGECSYLDPTCIPSSSPKDPPGSTTGKNGPKPFNLQGMDPEALKKFEKVFENPIKDGGIYQ